MPNADPLLSITQTEITLGRYRADVTVEGGGLPRYSFFSEFDFQLTAQQQEDLRWYMEDYLQHPYEPSPEHAHRIEGWMDAVGKQLFAAIFGSNRQAQNQWARLLPHINKARVEIRTGVRDATAIPWELLRDPDHDEPLALRARAFVRAASNAAQPAKLPKRERGAIRVLLVICRPDLGADVPFRSVASKIIKSLGEKPHASLQLDVLRPATFEQLAETLQRAHDDGQPYHVVHFDGHGGFLDVAALKQARNEAARAAELQRLPHNIANRYSPELLYPGKPEPGRHGYLLFENTHAEENIRLVDGRELGKLLTKTGVPMLILNACQSAFADPPPAPETVTSDSTAAQPNQLDANDTRAVVKAFGSFAQEVMDAGVAGVVAMRYSVYVVTAAEFVYRLYTSLLEGHSLGEAVGSGRKRLHDDPFRSIGYQPIPLQDWVVPLVYESEPIALFPRSNASTPQLKIGGAAVAVGRGAIAADLPRPPEVGFWGRDETLLALDRAFDSQRIVLLHAYAGSGKTATAAEFARWYSLTGGVTGPILYNTFEHLTTLANVLSGFGAVFAPALEQAGIQWAAIEDYSKRRAIALQVMHQIPVLWVWDNVEQVAGFPEGTESQWSAAEQQELRDFLRDAAAAGVKFLLTSRRDEHKWLGNLPTRVAIPPMPMQERVQLARALAERYGQRFDRVQDWQPLLRFTGGNPLTITVVVGQALRDGIHSKQQIEEYVHKLRAGETAFADDKDEGRSKSLGASLEYGLDSFSQQHRKQLALLNLFQGFVDVDILRIMGAPEAEWCVPALRGLSREQGIALLDRAAEAGLLTAHGKGYYTIHPALPWFFHREFEQYYAADPLLPIRAFVEAEAYQAQYYFRLLDGGDHKVFGMLAAEEDNLRHAWQLARAHGWLDRAMRLLQPLTRIYYQTGHNAELDDLLQAGVHDYVDPETNGPRAGLGGEWSVLNERRADRAIVRRQWAEAEAILIAHVEWLRQQATSALALAPEQLDAEHRNRIRSLGLGLSRLGGLQSTLQHPECIATLTQAADLARLSSDQKLEADVANDLGNAYLDIPALRDLDQAANWYRRSLEVEKADDNLGRATSLYQLGKVEFERFDAARKERRMEDAVEHLSAAAQNTHAALDLTLPTAPDFLADENNLLGSIYGSAGDLDRALSYYRTAIRYHEAMGDQYKAAAVRYNVALDLWRSDRNLEALDYAQAALRGFIGLDEKSNVQITQRLVSILGGEMRDKGGLQ